MNHASLNRSYRLVRNADGLWVAAPETARGHGAAKSAAGLALLALSAVAFAAGPAATQLPTGGAVVAGQASIGATGATLNINQASQRAVIDWQTFNLGSGATVNFNQAAGRSAATLNRVLDMNPSQIQGAINAPGQVFVSNPYGVIFGATANVNVGGLVATTMSISPADFMAGKSLWQLNGATGSVVNQGSLNAADGGYVALLAPEVRNEGVVFARAGTVALAAGEAVRLDFSDNALVGVTVTPAELRTLVENKRAILAEGGLVILAARTADALRSGVVKQSGTIDAGSLVSRGGRILLEGDDITLAAGSSTSANGAQGGGTVHVGGGWQGSGDRHQATTVTMEAGARIEASATVRGDGGEVVLWSRTGSADSLTRVAGTIAADGAVNAGGAGGRVETSGHDVDFSGAKVTARSAKDAQRGQWLVDPVDVTVDAGRANALASTLDSGTDATVDTGAAGADAGNIKVAAPIHWSADSRLTLNATNNIDIAAPITADGGNASLMLAYGQGAVASGNTGKYTIHAPVTLQAGPNFITRKGSDGTDVVYTVVTDIGNEASSNDGTLQGIRGGLAGNYALGSDIEAFDTPNWNGGLGFQPIGDTSANFSGLFEGLGHTVSNLVVNRGTTTGTGLFGETAASAVVRDVGMYNVQVHGSSTRLAGGLIGRNFGTVESSYVMAGYLEGIQLLGGLIGDNQGTVRNAYANASVWGVPSSTQIGGFAGNSQGNISYSYATGSIRGQTNSGGFIGYDNGGTVLNSYAAVNVTSLGGSNVNSFVGYKNPSAVLTGSGAIGNPTSAGSFTGFDFVDDWTIYAGMRTPMLNAFLRPLTVSTVSGVKVYDRTLNVDPANVMLSDPDAAGSLLGTLVYTNASVNAGSYVGAGLGGLASGQVQGWRISYDSQPLTITPKALTVTGAQATSRVYNAGTSVGVSYTGLQGVVAGDSIGVLSTAASFADKDVGTAKPVTTAFTLAGNASGNYTLQQPSGLTANITPASLYVFGVTANGKTYDGTPSASLGGTARVTALGSDVLTLGGTGVASFDSKNVGTSKPVTVSGYTLGGADAGNYTLFQPVGLTASIGQADLAVAGVSARDKTYDGSTGATLSGTASVVALGADVVSVVGTGSASFADRNAGSGKAVTVGGYSLAGADATNYRIVQPAGLSATITPATLGITGAAAQDRVYDGSVGAVVTGGALQGRLGSDQVVLGDALARFGDKNAGVGKAVSTGYTLSGSDAGNYALVQPAGLTASITPALLSVGGAAASSKVYDGGTVASVVGGTLAGVVTGDTVALLAQGRFADANVGGGKPVAATYTLAGVDAGNYALASSGSTLHADIAQRASVTWIGGAAGNWFDAVNWADGATPTLSNVANVVIPGGAVVSLAGSTTANAPSLVGVSGGGALQLAQATLNASGAVALNAVSVGADAVLNAGSLSVARYAQSGGKVVVAGALDVQGRVDQTAGTLRAGTAHVVQASGNLAVTHLVASDVSLQAQAGDLAFTNLGSTGNATLRASGAITEAAGGSLTTLGTTTLAAGGQITLAEARNTLVGTVSASGTDVALRQGTGELVLGDVRAASLLATGPSNVRQADGSRLDVAGTTQATSGSGSIYFMADGNRFGGAVSARGLDVALTQGAADLVLGRIDATRNFQLYSGGDVSQTASVTVGGRTGIDALGHAVVLGRSDNDFAGSVTARAADLTLVDGAGGLLVGNIFTSGTTRVDSLDGAITSLDGSLVHPTGPVTAAFNAWQGGAYVGISINTNAAVMLNGVLGDEAVAVAASAASIDRGIASAIRSATASALPVQVEAASVASTTGSRDRREAVPAEAAAPVKD